MASDSKAGGGKSRRRGAELVEAASQDRLRCWLRASGALLNIRAESFKTPVPAIAGGSRYCQVPKGQRAHAVELMIAQVDEASEIPD